MVPKFSSSLNPTSLECKKKEKKENLILED